MSTPPADDIFNSDPFFSEDSARVPPAEPEEPLITLDELPGDDVPTILLEPAPAQDAPALVTEEPTAEERLLKTIVEPRESSPLEPSLDTPGLLAEIAALQADLAATQKDLAAATTARDRVRQDLHILKTRFASLESDLEQAKQQAALAQQEQTAVETRFAEAEAQWSDKVVQLRRMLDEVESLRDELATKRVSKVLFAGVCAAGVLATGLAFLIGFTMTPRASDPEPAVSERQPPVSPPLPVAAQPVLPRPQPLVVPSAASPHHVHLPQTPLEPPASLPPAEPVSHGSVPDWPALKNPHWSTTQTSEAMTLVFNETPFADGSRLTESARQDLRAIALVIKGHPFRITVEGHTDPSPVRKTSKHGADNNALGLARAKAAAACLTQEGGVESSMVSALSKGDDAPPFPNTSAENRRRNRTVVLRITR